MSSRTTAEEIYWREHFYSRPYVRPEHHWRQFAPAFRRGWEARLRDPLGSWEFHEPVFERWWRSLPDRGHKLPWNEAKLAMRDAWDHAGIGFG